MIEVPKLTARDLCREQFNKGKQSCLHGWSMRVAGIHTNQSWLDQSSIIKALHAQIEKSKYHVESRHGHPSVCFFNDDEKVPKKELARVWNAAMTDLGFGDDIDVDGTEAWGKMRK